jgi:DNA-directed RNA polymerase subunit M/transcription elongation factor TFIIS
MKFCTQCDNMMYNIEESDGSAFIRCRQCSYKEPITKENPVVYEHDLLQDTAIRYSINPYLKHDPTLPRFTNMKCPNVVCPTKGSKESNIVGIKLDAKNVVWMYQCAVCNSTWRQAARGP